MSPVQEHLHVTQIVTEMRTGRSRKLDIVRGIIVRLYDRIDNSSAIISISNQMQRQHSRLGLLDFRANQPPVSGGCLIHAAPFIQESPVVKPVQLFRIVRFDRTSDCQPRICTAHVVYLRERISWLVRLLHPIVQGDAFGDNDTEGCLADGRHHIACTYRRCTGIGELPNLVDGVGVESIRHRGVVERPAQIVEPMNELDEPSSATAAPFEAAETESREAAGGIEAYRFPVLRVVHFNGLVGGVPYQRRPADGDAMVDIDVGHGHEGRDIEQFPALRIFIKLKDVEIGVDEFVAEIECPEVGVDFPLFVPPDIAGGQIARAVHADQGRGLGSGMALLFDVFPGFLVVGKAIHGLSARPVGDTAGSPVETAHPAHDDILAFGSAVAELHEARGDDTPVDGGVVTKGFFEVFALFKRLVEVVVVLGNEFALDS